MASTTAHGADLVGMDDEAFLLDDLADVPENLACSVALWAGEGAVVGVACVGEAVFLAMPVRRQSRRRQRRLVMDSIK